MIVQPLPIPPEPFGIEVAPDRDWVIVMPHGELDLGTLPRLEQTVAELREVGFEALRIDLRGLTFADSCLVHFILALTEHHHHDGLGLEVIPGPPAVQRVFALALRGDGVPFV